MPRLNPARCDARPGSLGNASVHGRRCRSCWRCSSASRASCWWAAASCTWIEPHTADLADGLWLARTLVLPGVRVRRARLRRAVASSPPPPSRRPSSNRGAAHGARSLHDLHRQAKALHTELESLREANTPALVYALAPGGVTAALQQAVEDQRVDRLEGQFGDRCEATAAPPLITTRALAAALAQLAIHALDGADGLPIGTAAISASLVLVEKPRRWAPSRPTIAHREARGIRQTGAGSTRRGDCPGHRPASTVTAVPTITAAPAIAPASASTRLPSADHRHPAVDAEPVDGRSRCCTRTALARRNHPARLDIPQLELLDAALDAHRRHHAAEHAGRRHKALPVGVSARCRWSLEPRRARHQHRGCGEGVIAPISGAVFAHVDGESSCAGSAQKPGGESAETSISRRTRRIRRASRPRAAQPHELPDFVEQAPAGLRGCARGRRISVSEPATGARRRTARMSRSRLLGAVESPRSGSRSRRAPRARRRPGRRSASRPVRQRAREGGNGRLVVQIRQRQGSTAGGRADRRHLDRHRRQRPRDQAHLHQGRRSRWRHAGLLGRTWTCSSVPAVDEQEHRAALAQLAHASPVQSAVRCLDRCVACDQGFAPPAASLRLLVPQPARLCRQTPVNVTRVHMPTPMGTSGRRNGGRSSLGAGHCALLPN